MFFILRKLPKMPFLAVYRSVRATTQTNGVLMLGSCLLCEIFRNYCSSVFSIDLIILKA